MLAPFDQKLLSYLYEHKIISPEDARRINEKAQKSNASLESFLAADTTIDSDELLRAKGVTASLPTWRLQEGQKIGPEILKQIPEEAVQQYKFIPLERRGSGLVVGMVNPEDVKALEALRFVMWSSELKPIVAVITEEEFKSIFSFYRDVKGEVEEALEGVEKEFRENAPAIAQKMKTETLKDAPIIKIVTVILKHALEGRASDIHIEPLSNQTRVRFRLEGELFTSLILPSTVHNAVVARIKILADMRIDEMRIPQDGRFHAKIDNTELDFRVSTFPTSNGEKVVIRILNSSSSLFNLSDLGFAGDNLKRVEEAMRLPFGMILVSGPTGSGKSTTLYALLNMLPRDKINIVTLEDPIEYYMEGVSQSEIKSEIGYTFASGLRNILRQDPDVIMVGEIRDSETAELATHAALTGHLVLSTIHTNNAIGVIPRLRDMGVDIYLLPSALALVAAQRLVRRLCQKCKYQEQASPQIAKIMDEEIQKFPPVLQKELSSKKPFMVWASKGCQECGRKGYKGRVGIFEILSITPELKRLIGEGNLQEAVFEEAARKEGMLTLRQDGIMKALQGLVSMEEVLRAGKETFHK